MHGRLFLSLAVILPALFASPVGLARAQHAGLSIDTLPSGLRVAVARRPLASVVEIGVWYGCGSTSDLPGKTGAAHALEHMMFRGTPAVPERRLQRFYSMNAIEFGGATDYGYTEFYEILPRDQLINGLRIEADRMENLALRSADWSIERSIVLTEHDSDAQDASMTLAQAVHAAIFRGSTFATDPLGTSADVKRLQVSDLRALYAQCYRPSNATVVITGDVDPVTAATQARNAFANVGVAGAAQAHVVANEPMRYASVHLHMTGTDPIADIAFAAPGSGSQSAASCEVVLALLSSETGLLYERLTTLGGVDSFEFVEDSARSAGLYHLLLQGKHLAPVRRLRVLISSTIAQLARGGITNKTASAYANGVISAMMTDDGDLEQLADRIGYEVAVDGNSDPESAKQTMRRLHASDIVAALKTYFLVPVGSGDVLPAAGSYSAALVDQNGADERATDPYDQRDEPFIHRYQLRNGVRVYTREVPDASGVLLRAWIVPRPEDDSKPALALIAAMALDADASSYGFEFDFNGRFGQLPDMVAELSHALRVLPMASAEIADAKSEAIPDMFDSARNPDAIADAALRSELQSQPAPRISGQAISAVSAKSVNEYLSSVLRPERTVIVLVGNFDRGRALRLLSRSFAGWNDAGHYRIALAPSSRHKAPQRHTVHIRVKRELTRVLIGYPAPSESDPDFYPMLLLNQAIAGAPTLDTILMRELRLKRGLVYDVSSSYEHTAYRGRMVVEFETQPKYASKAAGIVFAAFERLRSAGISAADLAVAKRRMFLYELGAPTSLDMLADRLVDVASGIDSQAYVDDLANRCAAVAPGRLREVAKRYFAARNRAVVYEGN